MLTSPEQGSKQVERSVPAGGIRVFSLAIIGTMPHSIVRQPVAGRVCRLTDRNSAQYYLVRGSAVLFLSAFFIAVRLLRRREKFTEPDFALLA
jgi:hypothetical protein